MRKQEQLLNEKKQRRVKSTSKLEVVENDEAKEKAPVNLYNVKITGNKEFMEMQEKDDQVYREKKEKKEREEREEREEKEEKERQQKEKERQEKERQQEERRQK